MKTHVKNELNANFLLTKKWSIHVVPCYLIVLLQQCGYHHTESKCNFSHWTFVQCYLWTEYLSLYLFIQAYPDASLEATNSAIRPWDIQDYSRQM